MRHRFAIVLVALTAALVGAFLWNRDPEPREIAQDDAAARAFTTEIQRAPSLGDSDSLALTRNEVAEAPPQPVSVVSAPDPDMAPWEPWRKMRLEEIDRSLQVVVEDRDPRMRALQIQMFVIAAVAPLADERGLSERTSTADMSRPAQSDEHVFTANRNFYRVPKGTFPVLDDFMEIWQQRETRRDAMKLAEADRFDIDEPFPLDRFAINRLEQLASEARVAIERRSEPY